ncbi:hypothetical protein BC937DRAFT_94817 [Endogone sp. FLAS-F59071]|nr:hypothetical protein BC937DRAFT_94817 [Endogone sp. FLAS-F59071]|eukprot:RUS13766.1 hypothetical protein BC937DRAFT_94817 [Endogone sp. FLAS-F59071]
MAVPKTQAFKKVTTLLEAFGRVAVTVFCVMTRTVKQSSYRGSERNLKHFARNGLTMSPRSQLKKQGAGRGNWGRQGDEINEITAAGTVEYKSNSKIIIS